MYHITCICPVAFLLINYQKFKGRISLTLPASYILKQLCSSQLIVHHTSLTKQFINLIYLLKFHPIPPISADCIDISKRKHNQSFALQQHLKHCSNNRIRKNITKPSTDSKCSAIPQNLLSKLVKYNLIHNHLPHLRKYTSKSTG